MVDVDILLITFVETFEGVKNLIGDGEQMQSCRKRVDIVVTDYLKAL